MKQYWQNLNDREKLIVVLGVSALLLYMYYIFLYQPLKTNTELQTKQLVEKTQLLQWMKTLDPQQNKRNKNKTSVDNTQLLTIVAEELQKSTLAKFTSQLQQTNTGDIQISFDLVPYNQFMIWLLKLNNNYTVLIKQFNSEKREKPGLAHVLVILSASSK